VSGPRDLSGSDYSDAYLARTHPLPHLLSHRNPLEIAAGITDMILNSPRVAGDRNAAIDQDLSGTEIDW
jgi:hypothetical protein